MSSHRFLAAIAIFLSAPIVLAATILTDTNGATVQGQTADGSVVQLNEGDEILAGTQINLGKDQSVTLSTDTGMFVVADQDAKFKFTTDEDNVPVIEIALGEVRASLSAAEQKPATPTPRLRIATPSAVVGVRGTDFVVNSGNAGTDVHTLEGTVEVAGSREDLRAGRTTALQQGEGVEGVRHGQPFAKKTFNRDEFMRGFNQRHPRFAAMHARAEARRAHYRQALQRPRQNFKQWQEHRAQAQVQRRQNFIKNHAEAAKKIGERRRERQKRRQRNDK